MRSPRTSAPVFKAHVVALVAMVAAVLGLTLTVMWVELAALRGPALVSFLALNSLYNLLGGLALKRIGHSPWLGLTGYVMGLLPMVLYLALPEKRPAQD